MKNALIFLTNWEIFSNFSGLLRISELYHSKKIELLFREKKEINSIVKTAAQF